VALVLSGGGARGFAHVGVLHALKEMRVPVDLVAGVSMGAVVGGAYASGRSVEELEAFVRATEWAEILSDRPARDRLDFRRREDDLLVPSRIEFGVGRQGLQLPPGTVGNEALEAALVRLLPAGSSERPLNRLALPFRSVASDLLSGEMVEFVDTPLFLSLRASLAMPGVFSPIRVGGRLVVDGGLVRNLPVDIARAMGAEVVIAVNVGTPLSGEDQLGSALGVAQQMLHILTEQNVRRSLGELTSTDLLIAPDLRGVRFLDFSRAEAAMAAGERAAREMAPRLRALAVSEQAYAAFERARLAPPAAPDAPRRLARLEVQATEHAGSAALQAQLPLTVGQPASTQQVHEAAGRLLGSPEFERVEVEIRDQGDTREVKITPVEAGWAHSRLRVGLELSSDFGDESRYAVSALHTLSWLNSWGAELRTLARVGTDQHLALQLWQPVAPGSPWAVVPSLEHHRSNLDLFEGGQRSQRFAFRASTLALNVGRQFSNWGQVLLGVERRVGAAHEVFAGQGQAQGGRFSETAQVLQVQVDTLDGLALPSRGVKLLARAARAEGGEADGARHTGSIEGLVAFRLGDWAGHVWAEWARSSGSQAPLQLGGFLRLSGTPRESLTARAEVLTRLVMARRIGEMPAGLGGALRAGYSLELGGGYEPDLALRMADLKRAGSVFVSVDTRFGPLFLAYGATRGSGSKAYLFLGPFW
jgi:NTE family protein